MSTSDNQSDRGSGDHNSDILVVADLERPKEAQTFVCMYSLKCSLPDRQKRENVLKCRVCKNWFHHLCANQVHGTTEFSECGFCVSFSISKSISRLKQASKSESVEKKSIDFSTFFTDAPCAYKQQCTNAGAAPDSKCERCLSTYHSECCPFPVGQGCPCYFLCDLHQSESGEPTMTPTLKSDYESSAARKRGRQLRSWRRSVSWSSIWCASNA
jgi:hypothetical protein